MAKKKSGKVCKLSCKITWLLSQRRAWAVLLAALAGGLAQSGQQEAAALISGLVALLAGHSLAKPKK